MKRVVVSFTLPSNGERWNWPIGEDSVDAFVEILDRAGIAWSVRGDESRERPQPVIASRPADDEPEMQRAWDVLHGAGFVEPPPDDRVLGRCPHGVDLDREFCPDGCRV